MGYFKHHRNGGYIGFNADVYDQDSTLTYGRIGIHDLTSAQLRQGGWKMIFSNYNFASLGNPQTYWNFVMPDGFCNNFMPYHSNFPKQHLTDAYNSIFGMYIYPYHHEWKVIEDTFDMPYTGYQQFCLPYAGKYRIEAWGGAGGVDTTSNALRIDTSEMVTNRKFAAGQTFSNGFYRPPGAYASGEFEVSVGYPDDYITIACGVAGHFDDTGWHNPGGGGGTFVTYGKATGGSFAVDDQNDILLLAAGGGGGFTTDGTNNNVAGGVGQATQTNTYTNSSANGTAGNGAPTSNNQNNSSGGAGYNTNTGSNTTEHWITPSTSLSSAISTTAVNTGRAYAFRRGGLGASHTSYSSIIHSFGAFGGGGNGSHQQSSDDDKGGGGGYSGGAYAFDAYENGNGGGSYYNPAYMKKVVIIRGGQNFTDPLPTNGYVFFEPAFSSDTPAGVYTGKYTGLDWPYPPNWPVMTSHNGHDNPHGCVVITYLGDY